MTALFWTLADAAFAAGWVVMALCLFRWLCRKVLPRWLTVAMWLPVAVRLVCPFSIESEASLMPEPLSYTVNTYWVQADIPTTPDETLSDVPTSEPVVSEPISDAPAVSWEVIACGVWLVGVVAMLGYMAVSYTRLQHTVRTATRRDGNIYECETVESPFILGVIRPRIYLPYAMSDDTREHALAHERAHIARGDHIWKFAAFVLLSVYWFNPLLWLAYYLLCRDIEFACDEKVVRHLSQDQRKTYSHALLSSAVTHHVRMCPLAFGEVGVEARVKGVMKYKKPLRTLVVIAVAACGIVAWRLVTDPPAPAGTTLENAYVQVLYDDPSVSEQNAILVEKGNRLSLHTADGKPLQLVIEEIDTEDMAVTVSFSQKLYRDGKEGRRIAVGLGEQEVLSTAKSGGGELCLTLHLPTAVTAEDDDTCEAVYFGNGMTLRLYEDYYRLQFGDEDDIYGTYEQTADTLTLTQDAHLTEYVFRTDGKGGWQYDADASYRHKLATSPAPDKDSVLAFGYRYEMTLVNQHYNYTVFNAKGERVLASYSAFGEKPVFTMEEMPWLSITVNAPAANPRKQLFYVNVETGEMPTRHGGEW